MFVDGNVLFVILFLVGVAVVLSVVSYKCGYMVGANVERKKWVINSKPMQDGITPGKMMRSTNTSKPKCERPDGVGVQSVDEIPKGV